VTPLQTTGNTILITGATSGIGRGLALELYRRGNRVIITGRRQALLDQMVADCPGMVCFRLDVEDARAIGELARKVSHDYADLNVLINNAGISRAETLVDGRIELAVAEAIIGTNVFGVLRVTAEFLPLLQRQPQATIVTTTSGLAFVPRSAYPVYCASKAFLHSWLQSLRSQLMESAVEVLELVPPYVQTELAGPHQASDPSAMPLNDYLAEVFKLIDEKRTPHGEILVERVKRLRHAEATGKYSEVYAGLNSL
jgi:uncharacterized oxidoreductase